MARCVSARRDRALPLACGLRIARFSTKHRSSRAPVLAGDADWRSAEEVGTWACRHSKDSGRSPDEVAGHERAHSSEHGILTDAKGEKKMGMDGQACFHASCQDEKVVLRGDHMTHTPGIPLYVVKGAVTVSAGRMEPSSITQQSLNMQRFPWPEIKHFRTSAQALGMK